jgi:8-oxo-dGTP pyrophosphatase MutT (NUDIX family)
MRTPSRFWLVGLGLIAGFSVAGRAEAKKARWESAGAVVFNDEGKIALVKQRSKTGRGDKWTWPKGKIDAGESSKAAAKRETNEEAGLKGIITGEYGVHKGPRHNTHYFRMKLLKDRGTHDHEVKEVKWVSPKKAKKMVSSNRDRAVARLASEFKGHVRVESKGRIK